MAAGRKTILLIGLTLMAALGGCEGMTMDQVFGIGDGTNELAPPPPPAPTPTPTPVPTPKASPPSAPEALKRNVAFDVLRTRGISQVYEGRTKVAVGSFQSAQQIKPKDKSVGYWLAAIEISSERQKAKFFKPTDFEKSSGQIQPPAPGGLKPAPSVAPATPRPSLSPVDPRLVF
jgi:hypothetical protein